MLVRVSCGSCGGGGGGNFIVSELWKVQTER